MKEKFFVIVATMFLAVGIGLLISPAFNNALEVWNLIGMLFIGFGVYFLGSVL